MKAYELIADPANWIQGHFAMTADGVVCDARGPEACKWCAAGAISRAYGESAGVLPVIVPFRKLREYIMKSQPDGKGSGIYVHRWNDSSTHAEVYETLKALDI